ncbi:MAG: hypothetical protein CMH30_05105 [Micavibrio sp.]|nr:hypothetical protein [Micavibrio sp.]
MKLQRKPKEPEFSYMVDVDDLPPHSTLTIEATKEQCEALVSRFNVVSVESVKAVLDLHYSNSVRLHVKGVVEAHLTQNCVVTLEPINTTVKEEFDAFFMKKTEAVSFAKAKRDRIVENQDPEAPFLDEEEDPEAIVDGMVDVGELATQYVCLGIDPYPRKEGAKHELTDEDKDIERKTSRRENPFAKLEAMKKILKEQEE